MIAVASVSARPSIDRTLSAYFPSLPRSLTSQTSAVPSALPEARVLPSADHASEVTLPRCPTKRRRPFPVVTSQSRMIRSQPAEARVRPSGEGARQMSSASSPRNRRSSLPVAISQRRIFRSLQLPVKRVLPSGEKAAHVTAPWWVSLSIGHCLCSPVVMSQSPKEGYPRPPAATVLPSGEKAREETPL